MTSTATIDALIDQQAVCVLTLLVDHHTRCPTHQVRGTRHRLLPPLSTTLRSSPPPAGTGPPPTTISPAPPHTQVTALELVPVIDHAVRLAGKVLVADELALAERTLQIRGRAELRRSLGLVADVE